MPELAHWTTTTTVTLEGKERECVQLLASSYSVAAIEEAYEELFGWCRTKNYALVPANYSSIFFGNGLGELYIWTSFFLDNTKYPYTANSSLFRSNPCPFCRAWMKRGEIQCKSCGAVGRCQNCGIGGIASFRDGNYVLCSRDSCSKTCKTKGCGNRLGRLLNYEKCSSCDPRVQCNSCGNTFAPEETKTHKNYRKNIEVSICNSCYSLYVCTICSKYPESLFEAVYKDKQHKACIACVDKILLETHSQYQKWAEEDVPVHGSLLIPSSKQRPVRTISIETEFNGNGKQVNKLLYVAGLTATRSLNSYSAQGESKKYPCFMKTDSSVTGGELVTYLLDLDNENHAAALLRMTEVMRGANKVGQAEFTANAGGHIHIDLHGFDTDSLWSYYTLFMYLQMPLYYLAGAGADYGHRSLQGSRYGAAPTEGPFGSKKAFISSVFSNSKREGLNLYNYVMGLRNACTCGAILSGDWADCDCIIQKGTAEWRLWNSTINPRILHAWVSIMQSVTAWAQESKADEKNFPYLLWERVAFDSLPTNRISLIKERLEWMHRNLPLTMPERDSIVYACKKSQLVGLGETYLNSLLAIPTNSEFALKKGVKNPLSRRKIKFSLEKEEKDYETEQDSDYYEDNIVYDDLEEAM